MIEFIHKGGLDVPLQAFFRALQGFFVHLMVGVELPVITHGFVLGITQDPFDGGAHVSDHPGCVMGIKDVLIAQSFNQPSVLFLTEPEGFFHGLPVGDVTYDSESISFPPVHECVGIDIGIDLFTGFCEESLFVFKGLRIQGNLFCTADRPFKQVLEGQFLDLFGRIFQLNEGCRIGHKDLPGFSGLIRFRNDDHIGRLLEQLTE